MFLDLLVREHIKYVFLMLDVRSSFFDMITISSHVSTVATQEACFSSLGCIYLVLFR